MALGYTPTEAFLSFTTDLGEGEWGGIDADTFLKEGAASSLTASPQVRWKIKLVRALRRLSEVKVPAKTRAPIVIDRTRWDPAQKRLRNALQGHVDGLDEAKKQAANDMMPVFLVGKGGLGQTLFDHPGEVRHGRMQTNRAKDKFQESVALLALEPFITEIEEATVELAESVGMGPNQESQTAAAKVDRERQTRSECIRVFGAVLDDIAYELEQINLKEAERKQLEGLLSPLVALRDQYTAPDKNDPAESDKK
jgi:hypothetical protein